MNPKRLSILLLTGLLALAIHVPAGAQTTAGLRGQVLDKDGLPMPGATVTVTNPALGVTEGAVTDSKGEFRIVPLTPGRGYSLRVEFPGMGRIDVPDIELTPGRMTYQPITLRPKGELDESIRVTARQDIVNTESTTTQTSFTSEFIDSLPILGRNYQDVLTLAPGVSDTDGDGNPNIHGARDTDTVTLVDGVSTVDPVTGQVGQQLNIDSIQEIEVKTSGASAEFSRGQGGFVNIVTKSGGNDFEGSFKMFWQGDLFDGDGAGIDDPRLHGGLGESGLRDLSFNNYKPFVSVGGPIKKDKAWYFVTAEYIQEEEPVNALTQAFVRKTVEKRVFGKFSWDVSTNHKLVFTTTLDPQTFENQGVGSFVPVESGYTTEQGGLNLVLKETSIFSPNAFLETTVQKLTTSPERIPTLNADTNNNGVLYIDRNGDSFIDATERDPGEDLDGDFKFDVWERDQAADNGSSGDQDGRVTPARPRVPNILEIDGVKILQVPCEGADREDRDCDGRLDMFNEDETFCENSNPTLAKYCNNEILDPGEDRDRDNYLDVREDRNNNNFLDDRPGHVVLVLDPDDPGTPQEPNLIPVVLPGIREGDVLCGQGNPGCNANFYPYGHEQPYQSDRDYTLDFRRVRFSGPYLQDWTGDRGRTTLREDLTLFVNDWHGEHDIKVGGVIEREHFQQTTNLRPWVLDNLAPPNITGFEPSAAVVLPAENRVFNEATSTTFGMYVEDTYKPLPNLTVKLGLRFDREATDSFGYTPFDPAAERDLFDRIGFLGGAERSPVGDVGGNGDGITSLGFCSDPIFNDLAGGQDACTSNSTNNPVLNDLGNLRFVASSRLTQHHTSTTLVADNLSSLFPDAVVTDPITGDKTINIEVLKDRGGATFQEEEPFRLTNNNLAPRISLSWDPWGDAKTRLFANWSRFYDKLFLGSVILEEGPDTITRYYVKDPDGVTDSGIPNSKIGDTKSKSPASFTQVDRGLQTPFSDELSIGFEREIAPEVSFKMTYISRKFRAGLQDRDINHEVRLDENGQMLDSNGRLLGGGGQGGGAASTRVADGKPDLYINNFFFNQIFRLENVNEAQYRSLEFQLTKRLSRKWQMEASYTYSRALGDAEDFTSQLGNDPASVAQEYGPLDFDQRHVVRLNAVTFLPGDWQLGSTISWSSGLPYTVLTTFSSTDNFDFVQANRRLFGTVRADATTPGGVFEPEQRNSRRNDAVYNIDVQASKAFVLGRFNSKFFLTIQDLLNTDDLRIFTFEPQQPNRGGNLQLNSERQFGRRFELGFQFEF